MSTTARLVRTWPLSLYIIGFPLWWALGVTAIIPMISAVAMAVQLARRERVYLPAGSVIWLLFVLWASFGVVLVFADAPGALQSEGLSALPAFGWRLGWYAACAVMLIWVANMPERVLPDTFIRSLMAYFFVVAVVGGIAGVLAPTVDFPSALELVLPQGIRSNGLVRALTHPALAEIQTVLGRPEARPQAPFAFANGWGAAIALLLPFFVISWGRDKRLPFRLAAAAVLVLATVPVVYSLNRGLWICLAAGFLGLVMLLVLRGRTVALTASVAALLVAAGMFALSPLGALFQERLENQHSNDRRALLIEATVSSATRGSPVVGFGSTRSVEGNFESIAGGETADCDACGVPPLGTQGQLWAIIFQQGYVGTALYFGFFAVGLLRSFRCRTTNEVIATFVLGFLFIQMLVYDLVGPPTVIMMIAIACVAREQRRSGADERAPLRTLGRLRRSVRPLALPAAVLALIGSTLGAAWALVPPPAYAARTDVLLSPSPAALTSAALDADNLPAEVTPDTEAGLIVSDNALARVVGNDQAAVEDLRRRVSVAAVPNTSVLIVRVTADDAEDASTSADTVTTAYLETRTRDLNRRRRAAVKSLQEQARRLDAPALSQGAPSGDGSFQRRQLRQQITVLRSIPSRAGDVIRTHPVVEERRQLPVPAVTGAGLGLLLAMAWGGPKGRRRTAARDRRHAADPV